MSFFSELKRRNVVRVAGVYAIVAWVIAQIISVINEPLSLPVWFDTVILVILIIGFPLALILAWAYELTPEGMKPTKEVDPATSLTESTGKKINTIAIGGLALVVLLLVLDNYILNTSGTTEGRVSVNPGELSQEQTLPTTGFDVPAKSIAVLPFVNLSDDASQEYFADGLSEELLNKLAQVQDLQVAGRTSSFYYKNKNEDLRDIGEALGVANILEGSVRKSGNQLRITAQLIKADDGFHLWSQTFDREIEDIFAIQDEIAEAVTTALSVTLGAGEFDIEGMTRNFEAYDEALKGQALFNEYTTDSILESLLYFERAVTIDPSYAIAWVYIGRSYGNLTAFFPEDQVEGYAQKVTQALEQAENLSPGNPVVQMAMASTAGSWYETEQILLSLIERYGNSSSIINEAYGEMLTRVGRTKDGLIYLQRAKRLDPLASSIALSLSATLVDSSEAEAALEEIERGLSLDGFDPGIYPIMSNAYMLLEDWDGVRLASENMNFLKEINLNLVDYLESGDSETGLQELALIVERGGYPPVVMHPLAEHAALLGDPQLAIELYKLSNIPTLTPWKGFLAEMRQLPEFKVAMRDKGFLEYWRTTGEWGDYCYPVGDDFECN